ncbi:MAG: response regulator transcription factor [Anaerolineales bacterium]|nr:response regulator transcription factor [Anaerolineales bacterium]
MLTSTYAPTSLGIRLLIVDDEANIRSSVGRALSLLGYTVEEAASGNEALAMLAQTMYDLMLLDMRMSPGLDGIEVMARARQMCPELLIVILTGHATMESAIAAVKSEAIDYLQKPASLHEIARVVTRSLEKRAGQRQRQRLVEVMGEALEVLRQTEYTSAPSLIPPDLLDTLYLHPLTLDRHKRLLMVAGEQTQVLHLTEGETAILASLMMCPDQILSCRDLIQTGWGYSANEGDAQNIIRPHICRLRRKINALIPNSPLLHTVRKRGYVLQLPH